MEDQWSVMLRLLSECEVETSKFQPGSEKGKLKPLDEEEGIQNQI